jgi:hypothetical protein
MSFNVDRTNNGHMGKVDLKTQRAFGHTSELEFSQCIRGSGLQSFTIPQQVKPGADNEILTAP